MIDVSAVQAWHGEHEVRAVAALALKHKFIACHALPRYTALLSTLLPTGCGVHVGGPVGFPSGGHLTATKQHEAAGLIKDGATEIDVMLAIGALKSGDDDAVESDLRSVIRKRLHPCRSKRSSRCPFLTMPKSSCRDACGSRRRRFCEGPARSWTGERQPASCSTD
ncbi:UNVERIFIED_CONTAM: hypothetical protein GTU68_018171 [Idotea baltica]|nr:hypothetical protein [Idotea baltica]